LSVLIALSSVLLIQSLASLSILSICLFCRGISALEMLAGTGFESAVATGLAVACYRLFSRQI
ncbi:MAG: hypothetical protein ACE37N_15150, partial [Pseudohongiellaceae bacterium]